MKKKKKQTKTTKARKTKANKIKLNDRIDLGINWIEIKTNSLKQTT